MQKVIGLITPYKDFFNHWVNDIGKKTYTGDEYKFVQISKIADVIGIEFYAVMNGWQYWLVNNDVIETAYSRVKKIKK